MKSWLVVEEWVEVRKITPKGREEGRGPWRYEGSGKFRDWGGVKMALREIFMRGNQARVHEEGEGL